jgi:hypothetical protein
LSVSELLEDINCKLSYQCFSDNTLDTNNFDKNYNNVFSSSSLNLTGRKQSRDISVPDRSAHEKLLFGLSTKTNSNSPKIKKFNTTDNLKYDLKYHESVLNKFNIHDFWNPNADEFNIGDQIKYLLDSEGQEEVEGLKEPEEVEDNEDLEEPEEIDFKLLKDDPILKKQHESSSIAKKQLTSFIESIKIKTPLMKNFIFPVQKRKRHKSLNI